MLSADQVAQFQELYRNRFGRVVSPEEALEKGVQLMRLVELVYKPMTENEYKKLQKRRLQTSDI